MAKAQLQKIENDLWQIDGEPVRFLGQHFPTRAFIIKLQSGKLWVWSPVQISDDLAREIKAIGDVAYLVSPNSFHHLFLGDWQKHFPKAQICGPERTQRKRPDLSFRHILNDEPSPAWRDEIDYVHFDGSFFFEEFGFFHHASGTLFLADMMIRLPEPFLRDRWPGWRRGLAQILGITTAQSKAPLETRLSFIRHDELRNALATINKWPIKRIAFAHGEMAEVNCTNVLKASFAWVRGSKKLFAQNDI